MNRSSAIPWRTHRQALITSSTEVTDGGRLQNSLTIVDVTGNSLAMVSVHASLGHRSKFHSYLCNPYSKIAIHAFQWLNCCTSLAIRTVGLARIESEQNGDRTLCS